MRNGQDDVVLAADIELETAAETVRRVVGAAPESDVDAVALRIW